MFVNYFRITVTSSNRFSYYRDRSEKRSEIIYMSNLIIYSIPNNTYNSVSIPVTSVPTPLASITVHTSPGDAVALRAEIGWMVRQVSNITPTNVIFRFWRGTPVTGTLLFSAIDSGETFFDMNVVTSLAHIDTGFTFVQDTTYMLTAEVQNPNTSATVVGPLSFTATRGTQVSEDLLFYELPENTAGSISISVSNTPQPLATLTVNVAPEKAVLLRTVIGWRATGVSAIPKTDVIFKLWRGAPVTGTLIFSADDSADIERNALTAMVHVDSGFTASQQVTYVLTAEAPDPGKPATIIGPITFTAAPENANSPQFSFFTLPNNTVGGALIPILTTPTPLSAVTVQAAPGEATILRAGIGWMITPQPNIFNTVAGVLFKLWRGAPITGTLVSSALDSGDSNFDNRKVTRLLHIDTGFTASQPVTYTLTAELTTSSSSVNVIGPLTQAISAVPFHDPTV